MLMLVKFMFIKFEEIEHEGRVDFVIDLHY